MNKERVLKRPEAEAALKNFVVAALYTDKHTQYREVQSKRFKSIALPLYVILGPDGKERTRLDGQITLEQFLAFLDKGRNGETSAVHPDLPSALAEARASGKPVFLEFNDVTSLNSLHMRERVLKRPAATERLRQFVVADLPVDRGDRAKDNRQLLTERFKRAGMPTYVALGPDGETRAVLSGMASETDVVAFLEKGLGR